MRFYSLSLLLAVGMAGLSGCGGAGSGGAGQPVLDDPYDTPPSTYQPVAGQDSTPAPYDTPPTDYQSPSGDGSSSADGAGQVCPVLCGLVTGVGCLTGQGDQAVPVSEAQCETQCSGDFGSIASRPCVQEAITLFSCLLDKATDGLSCEDLTRAQEGNLSPGDLNLGDQVLSDCAAELSSYGTCRDAQQPMQDPGGRCMPNRCNACPDDCARCDCDQDAAACAACTPPAP